MRFIAMVKATPDSEAGIMPSEKLMRDMGNFNEELVKAGVLLAGEGLQPSSKGARVRFNGTRRTVVDGPFTETKELIAGFWLLQCKSLVEIRQVFEAEDFGAEFTPELRAQEERLRGDIAKHN